MIKQTSNHKTTLFLSLLIVGLIIGLLVESSQPPLPLFEEVKGLDKAAHFLAFGVFGLLVCGLWFTIRAKPTIPLFSMPLLFVTLFGAIEECYQMFVPGRSASMLDLLVDICGAACAIIIANRAAVLVRVNNQIAKSIL